MRLLRLSRAKIGRDRSIAFLDAVGVGLLPETVNSAAPSKTPKMRRPELAGSGRENPNSDRQRRRMAPPKRGPFPKRPAN